MIRPNRADRAQRWTGDKLVDRVANHAASAPTSLAVVAGREQMTFGEIWGCAGVLAEEFAAILGAGRQIVLIDLPNRLEWMIVFLATLRGGHVPATIPVTTTASHLRHVVDLLAPALVIAEDPSDGAHEPTVEIVERATASATSRPIVATTRRAELIVRSSPTVNQSWAEVSGDVDHLMFTSSTTGPPKAVSHTEDTLATLNRQIAARFGLDNTTPIFMPSPLGHSVGAIHGARLSLYLGAPLVLQDRWDPVEALRLAAAHRAAFMAAATPFLLDLLGVESAGGEVKLQTVKTILCGGAQVPPALIRRGRKELPNTFVTPLWGMTEGGVTTCLRDSSAEQVENSVGTGLPGLELRVLNSDGESIEVGEGELVMRGPGVFRGYYGQSDLYEAALTSDGYFRTGDLARISEDGYVKLIGRLKDLVIRGAVNISPVETENTLAAHPDIFGVAVIGWPDDRLGERLCAVVHAARVLSLDELIDFCSREGLEKRYWPERLELVDNFPRTAAGKIRKQQLRDQLLARYGLGADTGAEAR